MSLATYSDIADSLPLDSVLVEKLATWILHEPVDEFRVGDMVDFLECDPDAIRRVTEVGLQRGAFKRELRRTCCGLSFHESDATCDECGGDLSGRTETEEVIVVIRRPTKMNDEFAVKPVEEGRLLSLRSGTSRSSRSS
jgi:hypothetical protein